MPGGAQTWRPAGAVGTRSADRTGRPRGAARPALRPAARRVHWQRAPGVIFAAVTVLPALLLTAWLLPGLPLLLASRFTDIPMLVISVPLAVALIVMLLRELPSAWPHGIRDIWDVRLPAPREPSPSGSARPATAHPAAGRDAALAGPEHGERTGAADLPWPGSGMAPAGLDTPEPGAGTPASGPDSPAWGPEAPAWGPESPGSGLGSPGSGPGSPGSGPGSGKPEPGTATGTGGDGTGTANGMPAEQVPDGPGPGSPAAGSASPGSRLRRNRSRRGRERPDVPWWALAGTIAVAAGFAVWQLAENSQQIIVLRDPGTYLQFAYWIAGHGSVRIPQSLPAFGGAHQGLTFSSLGFYASGTSVVPQFMAGLPITLAMGVWAGGQLGAVAMAPVIGACAILAFSGLAGRLVGARWAPAAALVLAVSLPEQYTSRTTFSETLAQVMLYGGLCMLADSFVLTGGGRHTVTSAGTASWQDGPAPNVTLAFLGGLSVGLTLLVRIDGLSDLLPAIPFLGILFIARRPQAVPFAAGMFIGAAYGFADGYLLSRPYLDSISSSLRPLAMIALGAVAVTVSGIGLMSVQRIRSWLRAAVKARPLRWLPEAAAAVTVLAVAVLAARPYFQTVRGETNPATISYVAELQKLAHLPIDPRRQYSEDSLYWVIWYIGVPAVILGAMGIALLARRCLRALLARRDNGSAWLWTLPLMIIVWVTATVLWRPGIIPDQPWASRRLVPVVLPGLILAAVWMAAWIKDRGRRLGASRVAAVIVAVCCVIALLVPAAVTTFGAGTTRTAAGRTRLTASGLAFKRTGAGEDRAVQELCASIGPNASVVIVDSQTADRFSQVIRGMCETPTARMDDPAPASVSSMVAGIEEAGRRPVLLAGQQSQLEAYGGAARQVLNLLTTQDAHELTQPPARNWLIHFVIWMSQPDSLTGGAVAGQAAEYSRRA